MSERPSHDEEKPKNSTDSQPPQAPQTPEPTAITTNHNESPISHPHPSPTNIQTILQEVVEATNPSLRHLASLSSLNSQLSRRSSPATLLSHSRSHTQGSIAKRPLRVLSTNFEEQRHPGKPALSITSTTKLWSPDLSVDLDNGVDVGSGERERDGESVNHPSVKGKQNVVFGSDQVTLCSEYPRSRPVSAPAKYKEIELAPHPVLEIGSEKLNPHGEGSVHEQGNGGGKSSVTDGKTGEEDEVVYPDPLRLFILIVGIALSVFLISLDRTIITTAVPFIENEFNSYSDVGWYGSAYLLTASAFQPLYGRIFMLFNMKWSYLASLFMFELGSLICGIAPNPVALIVGRSIAGLGSAGILTGSFVVVSHAVPLQQRPVLTAVVGLMFGIGATVGPLLGGVFTDLVTWRWRFFFNLPVGGATAAAMVFFFHPPRNHKLMGKSFMYRVMELDLAGNVILLGASVMLFLALQFTEQRTPWGSAKIVGLLTGCGVTFILFGVWQWWKADSALMPPRILGQRTVAASCAAAFFIYSAILVQSYYLPQWFQAIKGDSAIHSGVNMIPYVLANAVFSLLAGVFVSKNGYFVAPAIIGMAIGTVGSGLISTFDVNTSSSYWIGCEVLASAGIGMAIQQGFTAVQIVLPLDEVAIGTAAVVAFQSLGGAIFISVGNTILQNTLLDADLPGVDVHAVINAGAADFRTKVTAEQLPGLLAVYNDALQKVFIAAIPMAGLAVFACMFMEWRNVKDNKKEDLENAKKAIDKRVVVEQAILEKYRDSGMSGTTMTYEPRHSI